MDSAMKNRNSPQAVYTNFKNILYGSTLVSSATYKKPAAGPYALSQISYAILNVAEGSRRTSQC